MMIVLSHTLISILLHRQNPGRFKLTSAEDREKEEETNEDIQVS